MAATWRFQKCQKIPLAATRGLGKWSWGHGSGATGAQVVQSPHHLHGIGQKRIAKAMFDINTDWRNPLGPFARGLVPRVTKWAMQSGFGPHPKLNDYTGIMAIIPV